MSVMDARAPLTIEEAEAELEGLPLVAAMGGSMNDIKAVRAKCLAAGIPVLMGCPGGSRG
jgi:hypothetical protein